MRFLTKKIHRAYPELDKFNDEVCKRYVKRAKRLKNASKFWASLVFLVPLCIGVWVALMYVTGLILTFFDSDLTDAASIAIFLFSATGLVWLPALSTLLVRDRWLHHCIREQLTGVQCGACGYSLLGLSINNENDTPSVHCPECGHHLILKDMGLTQADIDPNHQPATP
ncbi:MAG: hypothetical protein ACSHX5_12680 [Phycisphaerales bacterium]